MTPNQTDRAGLVKRLRDLAAKIAAAGINGFGNECADIADDLAALTAQQGADKPAEPVAKMQGPFVCHFDGSKCGVGGYCDDCPHPAPSREAVARSEVVVPRAILEWLNGSGPHPVDGTWFERPIGAGQYWWRSEISKLLNAAPTSAKDKP